MENRSELPSGEVEILPFVGVTDEDRDLARAEGTDVLISQLSKEGKFQVTNMVRN